MPYKRKYMEKIHYIREIMQLKGVTVTELAKRLGVTQQSVSIQLTHDLRVSKAKRIADALGVPMSELFIEPKYIPTENKSSELVPMHCPNCGAELEISLKAK